MFLDGKIIMLDVIIEMAIIRKACFGFLRRFIIMNNIKVIIKINKMTLELNRTKKNNEPIMFNRCPVFFCSVSNNLKREKVILKSKKALKYVG